MVKREIGLKEENAINCAIRAMDFITSDEIFKNEIKDILRSLLPRKK